MSFTNRLLFGGNRKEAVSEAPFFNSTPKSPRGDLLKTNDLKSPLRGFEGKIRVMRQPLFMN